MTTTIRPQVRRDLRVECVPGEAVYLTSERADLVLEGELVERVLPLLDGKHSVDDVLDALDDVAPEQVLYLIERLVTMKAVVRAEPELPSREAAFWDMSGTGAERAHASLAAARVAVVGAGEVAVEPVLDALSVAGVGHVAGGAHDADLTVVLTDSYLNAELAEHNANALRTGRPWLLAKPVGSVLWVGPVFQPGTTGCWACLSQRLSGHRQVAEYLRERAGRAGPLPVPLADLSLIRDTGARLVTLQAVKFLAGVRAEPDTGLMTFDTLVFEAQRHPLPHRPQCPACGDARLMKERVEAAVRLESRPKRYVGDGGHRAQHPDDVLRRFQPLVSPVTGVVRELRSYHTASGFVKGYAAGHNFARRISHLRQLRSGLRSSACGKGKTDTQAKASAICEAIERYSGLFCGDEPRIVASLAELGERAIAPNECQLYSTAQYADRAAWNRAQRSQFQIVCDPLPANVRLEWTPVWSLTHERTRYLPTSYLYYHYPHKPGGPLYAWADSNGAAAGASREDAILQGFLELVERDSVALWWYNRIRRPAFDLDSFADPWFDEFREVYAGLRREVWVLDLTADLGIPVAAAVSRRTDKPAEDILMAFGAHFEPRLAVQRALAELNQFLPAVIDVRPDGTGYAFPDEVQQDWWRNARLADHQYLAPAQLAASHAGTHRDLSSDDLLDDIRLAQRIVESRGMEVLVLNQTRPDIELPVYKVMVPGLRHFWARFGLGRLYDVPVDLGWLDEPTPERALNPIPMFL
jgi:oxazoline/thiazoline synthase